MLGELKKQFGGMKNSSASETGRKQRMRMSYRPRMRLRQKMKFILPAVFSMLIIAGLIIYFQFSSPQQGRAAVSGDYKAIATGNWNSTGTWQTFNGSSWVSVGHTPTSADGVIEIPSGDTVTITASVTADQILVDAGGTLIVA